MPKTDFLTSWLRQQSVLATKLKYILDAGLMCIFAIGEPLPVREKGIEAVVDYCKTQLVARRSSKDFWILLVELLIFLNFASYGIWEDLAAWKILLQWVPMICSQFRDFSKMTQDREVSTFLQQLNFDPNRIFFFWPAKAQPRWTSSQFSKGWRTNRAWSSLMSQCGLSVQVSLPAQSKLRRHMQPSVPTSRKLRWLIWGCYFHPKKGQWMLVNALLMFC